MSAVSPEDSLAAAKAEARKSAAKVRAAAHKDLGGQAGEALARTGLAFLGDVGPAVVSGFYPYMSEIDLLGLMSRLDGEGRKTCLPIVLKAGQPLLFKAWAPGEATEPGAWDIPIPVGSAQTVEPDIMLVPLLSFDRAGYRLGYGGGFYDRTIEMFREKKQITAVGVAFAAQEVGEVVRGMHDQPLDWVLTETGPIETAKV
ncbi:MAG: 5-formyltetrahydrofolate cyclo-ligase [Alphaproteobacteria bacterium]|nr:5-formyltetrahydrofolate cyclo-ligase [Alphaproteobacteria bacterium]